MILKRCGLSFLMMAAVAIIAMPASAALIAYYPADVINDNGGAKSTPNLAGTWGDGKIATSGGIGVKETNDVVRGAVLEIESVEGALRSGLVDPFAGTGSMTVMFWVDFPSTATAGPRLLVNQRSDGWTDTYFQISANNDYRFESDAGAVQTDPEVAVFDQWVHYAATATLSGGIATVQLFKDGAQQTLGGGADDQIFLDPADAGTMLSFGNIFGKSFGITGLKFDDYAYFDTVLTGTEIQDFMNNGILPPSFAADFNNDTKVDGADLTMWEAAFGLGNGADADGDGDSDGTDFLIWQGEFGSGVVPAVQSIPEPSGIALAVLGFLGLLGRRGSLGLLGCPRRPNAEATS